MAYETAGASGVNDLLDKLRVFALAQGWTVDFNGARTDVTGNAVLISKAGLRYGFLTQIGGGNTDTPADFIGAFQYPGPYSGSNPHAQASASVATYCNNMPGPFAAYHFFAGTNKAGDSYLHVVVEAQPGSFRHFGVGVIDKLGAITNGAYNYGSRWNYSTNWVNSLVGYHNVPWDSLENSSVNGNRGTAIRCDGDAISPRYGVFNSSDSGLSSLTRIHGGPLAGPTIGLSRPPSTLTGRTILLPAIASIQRPSGFFTFLGAAPDLRFANITNLLPGELITLGPDTWKVFPVIRKNGVSGQENSGTLGYAYRVVP